MTITVEAIKKQIDEKNAQLPELLKKQYAALAEIGRKAIEEENPERFGDEFTKYNETKTGIEAIKAELETLNADLAKAEEEKKALMEKSTCRACGFVNPEGYSFCRQCGKKLGEPPPAPTVDAPKPMFCIHCGTPVVAGAKFCSGCGKPLA
ncbi:MAG TPA: zinc-ribbon domain-containing protein [Oscillospiraceae bacterium]|nr:zinc-ribbon domain-containing protein [Oscillospiraceae bacterium]HPS35379.1 zinc-ribbon domain-containing protein [Oscillospiraceae bacterium]